MKLLPQMWPTASKNPHALGSFHTSQAVTRPSKCPASRPAALANWCAGSPGLIEIRGPFTDEWIEVEVDTAIGAGHLEAMLRRGRYSRAVLAAGYVFALDLRDEGLETVLANLQARGGLSAVTMAAAYHHSRDVFPHNPYHKVVFLEG